MDLTLRALNRFGLGARPGERAGLGDPRAWLRGQLRDGPPALAAPPGASPTEIGDALRALRQAPAGDQAARQAARQRIVQLVAAEHRALLTRRVTSEQPFLERLVAFWSNHLCVSAGGKQLVTPLAGAYEREAIRPHVLGSFAELVLASARHPAMLFYLDNFQSIGPSAPGARLAGGGARARRGLNENHARELLELHTLGVAGGYTQQDVIALAKILTGWTVAVGPGPVRFAFRQPLHEPGSKTLLGTSYGETGVDEGVRAIRALCARPSTARFIAGKLAAHFIADAPPPAAVERLSNIFRASGGNLRAVSEALVDLPEAWREGSRKFRSPQDWVVAVLRALGAREASEPIAQALRQLRHPLWSPQSPKGYPDTTQEWADPDSLHNRAELARTIARRVGAQRIEPDALLDVVDVAPGDPLIALLADRSIGRGERLALALAGPAFQWR